MSPRIGREIARYLRLRNFVLREGVAVERSPIALAMAALMERVFDALREALAAAQPPTAIAPPPDAAESALKGLRRLLEPADGATAEQRRVGADALAALRARAPRRTRSCSAPRCAAPPPRSTRSTATRPPTPQRPG